MATLPLQHLVVSHAEWVAARKQFLTREKELTRLHDAVSQERQQLPWEKVERQYEFTGPLGKTTLSELFGKHSQLMIYHFMFGPEWTEGCKGCSFLADHIDGATIHLANRDVTMAVVSRAPYEKIVAFKKRMGWRFLWVSSHGSDFNFDFGVSFTPEQVAEGKMEYNYEPCNLGCEEAPGLSAFYHDKEGHIFHTYSAYARGGDILIGAYNYLDMAPKGRDEDVLSQPMAWVRHHDKYEEGYTVDPVAGWEQSKAASQQVG